MGNPRLYKIEWFHMLSTPESEHPKVTAPNLLKLPLKIAELPGEVIIFRIVSLRDTLPAHPTAPPPFKKSVSSYCDTVSHGERGKPVLVMVISILDFI